MAAPELIIPVRLNAAGAAATLAKLGAAAQSCPGYRRRCRQEQEKLRRFDRIDSWVGLSLARWGSLGRFSAFFAISRRRRRITWVRSARISSISADRCSKWRRHWQAKHQRVHHRARTVRGIGQYQSAGVEPLPGTVSVVRRRLPRRRSAEAGREASRGLSTQNRRIRRGPRNQCRDSRAARQRPSSVFGRSTGRRQITRADGTGLQDPRVRPTPVEELLTQMTRVMSMGVGPEESCRCSPS